jgi:hypothetical protein
LGFSPGKIARGQIIQKPPERVAFVFYYNSEYYLFLKEQL